MTEEAIIRPELDFLSKRTAVAIVRRERIPNAGYALQDVRSLMPWTIEERCATRMRAEQ